MNLNISVGRDSEILFDFSWFLAYSNYYGMVLGRVWHEAMVSSFGYLILTMIACLSMDYSLVVTLNFNLIKRTARMFRVAIRHS